MLIKLEVKIELPIRLFSLHERQEKVSDVICGECRLAKDKHDFEDGPAEFEVMFDDGNETIGDDGNVNMYPDGILRFPPEAFDLKVLEELGYLCKNELSYMHICSDFESDAKVRSSRFGQESVFQKCCA